jgi:prepilin-type N-terminal cleavage/methylation domain-containing protein
MKNIYRRGITMIELVVVIAVIGLLVSVVFPQFSKGRELQVLKSGVEDTLSSIDKARVETLSSLNSSSYGVHFQSNKVIIFTGTTFSAGASSNEIINIVTPANISNVTLGGVSSMSGDMYFNRLSGSPSLTGTVTISTHNYSKIITISGVGAVSSN